MTVTIRTIRRALARSVCVAALVGASLAAGCKSKDTNGGVARGAGGGSRSDPLLTGPGRIEPQNLPLPERGGTANGRRGDPLLGSPTGRPNNERSGYTDDPERFKGTYIPGPGSVPAYLSGRSRDGDELKIERPDPGPVSPASASLPPAAIPSGGATSGARLSSLEEMGLRRGDYTVEQDAGGVTLRVRRELPGGGVRQYTERGATEAEAVANMISQLKGDR